MTEELTEEQKATKIEAIKEKRKREKERWQKLKARFSMGGEGGDRD